jgi:hypothetical protein
LLAAQDR